MSSNNKLTRVKKADEGKFITDVIVKGMEEKKGHDIVVMDLRSLSGAVTDYFVICHADSDRQVEAIAKSVEEEVYKAMNEDPWGREGFENSEWILLDYVNVVVHVFQKEKREFFGLEELWGDAEVK